MFVFKYGHRMTVTLTGQLLMIVAHVSLMFIPMSNTIEWYNFIPFILLGISYATYTVVLWGALPYMVEARILGTAFGICTAFTNIGTTAMAPLVGKIYDATQHYLWVSFFFTAISVLALISNLLAFYYDKKYRGNIL